MFLSKDIGIDLGTANTLVHVRDEGIVAREPSVVAMNRDNGEILSVGLEAKRMIGRTPGNIIAIRPLKDGVIADFEMTQRMLKYFILKGAGSISLFSRPRVVVGIPSGVTAVEERAVRDAAVQSGAKYVELIEEPMAAAIGAGMPVYEPTGNMIVDIGGGTAEVAIISLGGIVVVRSARVAGDAFDQAIVSYIKRQFNLAIGERTAENIKMEIGSAWPSCLPDQYIRYEVRGRDLVTGLPKTIDILPEDINTAIAEPLGSIIQVIRACLEKSPPELASDILNNGIMLAGGGALLNGLDFLISKETGLPCHVAEEPLACVAKGTGKYLETLDMTKTSRFPISFGFGKRRGRRR